MSFPINFSTAQPTMSAFFKAELKDKFLEYASEKDDYFEIQLLYDEFLRPNYSLEFTEKLIREIIDFNPQLLDIMSGNESMIFMISGTAITKDFVEEGGFKDIYIEEEEKWDVFIAQLANSKKLSSKEKESLGHTEKVSRTRERKLLYFLITAVSVSFLFTLFSIVKDVFIDTNSVSEKELELQLNEIREINAEQQKKLEAEILLLREQLNADISINTE